MPNNRYQRNTIVNYGNVPNYESAAWGQVKQSKLREAKIADDFTALAIKSANVIIEQDKQIEGMLAGQGMNPKLKTGAEMLLPGSQKYNEGLIATYGIQVATDAQTRIAELAATSANSAEFKTTFAGYSMGVLKALKGDPRLEALAQSKLSLYGQSAYTTMLAAEVKAGRESGQRAVKDGLVLMGRDAIDAWRLAQTPSEVANAELAETQYLDAIKGASQTEDYRVRLAPGVGESLIQDYRYNKQLSIVRGGLQKEFERAGMEGAYRYVLDLNKLTSKDMGNITEEQRQKLLKATSSDYVVMVREDNRLRAAEESALTANQTKQTVNYMGSIDFVAKAPVDVETDVLRMVKEGKISDTDATRILSLKSSSIRIHSGEERTEITQAMVNGASYDSVMGMINAGIDNNILSPGDVQGLYADLQSGKYSNLSKIPHYSEARTIISESLKTSGLLGNYYKNPRKDAITHANMQLKLIEAIEKNPDVNPLRLAADIIDATVPKPKIKDYPRFFEGKSEEDLMKWLNSSNSGFPKKLKGNRPNPAYHKMRARILSFIGEENPVYNAGTYENRHLYNKDGTLK
jgi:hypothetical protein